MIGKETYNYRDTRIKESGTTTYINRVYNGLIHTANSARPGVGLRASRGGRGSIPKLKSPNAKLQKRDSNAGPENCHPSLPSKKWGPYWAWAWGTPKP